MSRPTRRPDSFVAWKRTAIGALTSLLLAMPSLPANAQISTAPVNPKPDAESAVALVANFPVPTGAVRKSFMSNRHTDTWQERAVFTVSGSADKIATDYGPQIAAAGWSLMSNSSTGTLAAGSYQAVQDYVLRSSKAHIVLGVDPKLGSSVSVTITTNFPTTKPSLAPDVNATPPAGPSSSPSDQGTTDPMNFPRLPGTVRSSYELSLLTGSRRESATYAASGSADGGEAFFRQGLSQAQWSETYRYVEIDDTRHTTKIENSWQTAGRTASLTLTSAANGASTVLVAVTTSATTPPATSTATSPKVNVLPAQPGTTTASSGIGSIGVAKPPVVANATSPATDNVIKNKVTALSKVVVEYTGAASFRIRWSCDDDGQCGGAVTDLTGGTLPGEFYQYSYQIYKKSANDSQFVPLTLTPRVNVFCTQSHTELDPTANCSPDFFGPDPNNTITVCDTMSAEFVADIALAVATPATFRVVRVDPSNRRLPARSDFKYNVLRLPK
jgi:hypothetical protein